MISTAISPALSFHNVSGKGIGTDEFPQIGIVRAEDGMSVTCPRYCSPVYETDVVSCLKHGIHIVSVDDSGHVEFLRQFADEFVDKDGCVRIETGVGLIAEKIFRAQGNGSGDADALLHAAGELGRIFAVAVLDIHLVEAEAGPFDFLRLVPGGEEIQREHHIFQHGGEIEQGAALEKYAYVLMEDLPALIIHGNKTFPIVEDISPVRAHKPYEVLQKHGLAAAAFAYYHIALSAAEHSAHVVQHGLTVERFLEIADLYHGSGQVLVQHKFGEYEVEQEDKDAAGHYGPCAAVSHSERAAFGVVTLESGYGAHQKAEYRHLETAVEHIIPVIAVFDALDIGGSAYYARGLHHHISAEKSEHKAQQHEKRTEESGGKHLGLNEERCGVHPHHVHGVDLLGNAHAAYLGCDVGPHLTGKDQGDHGTAELQDKAFADHIAHIHLVDERIFKVGGGLDDQHAADEQGYHGHYDDGGEDEFVRFDDELLPVQTEILRTFENHPQKKEKLSQSLYRPTNNIHITQRY